METASPTGNKSLQSKYESGRGVLRDNLSIKKSKYGRGKETRSNDLIRNR